MSEDEMIAWIDQASYRELLHKWRFDTVGAEWFQGRVGDHYSRVLVAKRDALPHQDQVAASKAVGWKS